MSKMKDSATVETLVRLLVGFDLMMVQEVVDVSGKAVEMLLEEANKDPGDAGMWKDIMDQKGLLLCYPEDLQWFKLNIYFSSFIDL